MITPAVHRFFTDGAWVEGTSLQQLDTLASSSDDIISIAAMPDLHPGKFGPVGVGMLSTEIHPPIVGSDIGCGMGLFKTDVLARKLKADRVAERLKILDEPWTGDTLTAVETAGIRPTLYDTGLGSIGSGNHFCELQMVHEILDPESACAAGIETDLVYLLVHTGSRGLGYSIMDGILHDGATKLAVDSERGQKYLGDHDHAVAWAEVNRAVIAERAAEAAKADATLIADLSHNFLERAASGILHRKGAAPADRGLVPIPGSRETLSYLVQPLTDAPVEAMATLAHGAGRKYDRASMHGRIKNLKSVREQMTRNPYGGLIVCEDRKLLVEEAGDAYKNIDRVIDDLVKFGMVKVVATFRPLITFKTGQAHIGEKGKR